MMLTRSQAQSIGWALVLAVCFALTVALTFRVNAVRSQVRLTERKIAALQAENGMLETEFETRGNQQQLTALNEVEFGYQAPTPGQYLESERQLAALGKPRGPDAPPMIRVAAADPQPAEGTVLPAMVNPLTGRALGAEAPKPVDKKPAARLAERGPASLAERLSHVDEKPRVERLAHVEKTPKTIDPKTAAAKLAGPAKPHGPAKEKAEPKLAKAGHDGVTATAKAAPKPAKAEPKLAKATAPHGPAAKPLAHKSATHGPVERVALKAPAKAHPGKSERVAID